MPADQRAQMVVNLTKYLDEVTAQTKKMEQQIGQLEDKISKAYDAIKTEPYHLHAIIIHEGNASSGHYYCYIKD